MGLDYVHSILMVDDETAITKSLQRLFRKHKYRIETAASGPEGLQILKKAEKPISLIISDQRMPEMTGAQFLEKAKEIFPDAIRFLLTGYSDMDDIVAAVNKGEIQRYLTKPWNDDDLVLQVQEALKQYELILENRRLLELTNKQNQELHQLNKSLEVKVEERTKEIKGKNEELQTVNKKLEEGFLGTVRLMSSLIGTLNPKLGQYMRDVAQLSKEVAEECGVDQDELDQIEIAAMIHDIGLLGLPENTWVKDEREMTPKEFNVFSQHPLIAQTCVESVERLKDMGRIIYHHHEHPDGSGFPSGLKGEKIPLGSRIIGAVADYCKILNTWPLDRRLILDRAKKDFGLQTQDLVAKEVRELISEVAQKNLLLKAHQKYDMEVVSILMKRVGQNRKSGTLTNCDNSNARWVHLDNLKAGMVLAADLRINDGRLLLAKGSSIKQQMIKSIQNLRSHQLLKSEIYVSF